MNAKDSGTYGRHIIQYPPEYSFCAGCNSCEIACTLTREGIVGPQYNRIFMERDIRTMTHTIHTCMHCADHPCYESCPKKDRAMRIDENSIVYIDETECIGCGKCLRACVFDPPRINLVKSPDRTLRKAKKCDLCRERAEGPACVQWCPVRCLGLSDEEVAAHV